MQLRGLFAERIRFPRHRIHRRLGLQNILFADVELRIQRGNPLPAQLERRLQRDPFAPHLRHFPLQPSDREGRLHKFLPQRLAFNHSMVSASCPRIRTPIGDRLRLRILFQRIFIQPRNDNLPVTIRARGALTRRRGIDSQFLAAMKTCELDFGDHQNILLPVAIFYNGRRRSDQSEFPGPHFGPKRWRKQLARSAGVLEHPHAGRPPDAPCFTECFSVCPP